MLRILLGETEVERQAQVHQLYERMFEQLTASIKPTLTNFADRIIGPLNEDETAVGKARALAAAGSHVSDGEIYHALNEHVSSDSCRDGPMTTGVVFRATSDGVPQYWVCLTPACDLVPGQNTTGWNGDLHPWRPITVARLTQISAAASVNTAMNNATHGRHIFLHLDSRSVALEVTHQYSRQMNIETILIANEGLIRDGVFEGRTITQDDANGLTLKELQFNVVALLRSDYANKLLAESGQQRARIGVDFFNMPVQPNG
jgi:hypothetical protein